MNPIRIAGSPGQPIRSSAEALKGAMLTCGEVGQREMRKVDLIRSKGGLPLGQTGGQPAAEDGQLITKPIPILCLQVAGVIPPLGLELEVWAVVAGRFKFQRLQGRFERGAPGGLLQPKGPWLVDLRRCTSGEQKSCDANSSQHEDQGRPRHGIPPIAGILSEFGPLTNTRPRLRKTSSSPWRSEQGAVAPAFTPGSAPAPLSVSGGGPSDRSQQPRPLRLLQGQLARTAPSPTQAGSSIQTSAH